MGAGKDDKGLSLLDGLFAGFDELFHGGGHRQAQLVKAVNVVLHHDGRQLKRHRAELIAVPPGIMIGLRHDAVGPLKAGQVINVARVRVGQHGIHRRAAAADVEDVGRVVALKPGGQGVGVGIANAQVFRLDGNPGVLLFKAGDHGVVLRVARAGGHGHQAKGDGLLLLRLRKAEDRQRQQKGQYQGHDAFHLDSSHFSIFDLTK